MRAAPDVNLPPNEGRVRVYAGVILKGPATAEFAELVGRGVEEHQFARVRRHQRTTFKAHDRCIIAKGTVVAAPQLVQAVFQFEAMQFVSDPQPVTSFFQEPRTGCRL